jgi:hypothetical protein
MFFSRTSGDSFEHLGVDVARRNPVTFLRAFPSVTALVKPSTPVLAAHWLDPTAHHHYTRIGISAFKIAASSVRPSLL